LNIKVKPEDISREIREVHKYRTDPLVHGKLSVGMAIQLIEKGLLAKRNIYRINVPLLVMHGTDDNVTSFKASMEFVQNAGPKTTFISWPESFHELHNDLDREEVMKSILDWLFSKINR
jgi:acylglycerol lipase